MREKHDSVVEAMVAIGWRGKQVVDDGGGSGHPSEMRRRATGNLSPREIHTRG